MAGALFCLEQFVVHADRHSVVAGLALVFGQAVLGLVLYAAVLAVLFPGSARELLATARNGRR
jgi:hypothetical protein